MANGSSKWGPAKADRIRERHAVQARVLKNAIDSLPHYREEMDSVSEVTVGKDGLRVKGPPWVAGVALLVALVALGVWLHFGR
jgi:hypothetical protein